MFHKVLGIVFFFGLFFIPFSSLISFVHASETNGTIDASYKYAWGENLGWINFKPDNGGLTITDSAITGYVWSRNFGWINFSPSNGGVTNTSAGNLGGNAWSTSYGWIDMSGVIINSSGKFTGISNSSGDSAGRISFDCDSCDVRTDWRPLSSRSENNDSSGGGGIRKSTPTLPIETPTQTPTQSPNHIISVDKPIEIPAGMSGTLTIKTDSGDIILEIPPGMVDNKTTYFIDIKSGVKESFSNNIEGFAILNDSIYEVKALDENNNPVLIFSSPYTLTFPIPSVLKGISDLAVYFFDDKTNNWVKISEAVFSNNSVTFSVNRPLKFAILGISDESSSNTNIKPVKLPTSIEVSNESPILDNDDSDYQNSVTPSDKVTNIPDLTVTTKLTPNPKGDKNLILITSICIGAFVLPAFLLLGFRKKTKSHNR